MEGKDKAYWLADKILAYGDYAKEAAEVLRQQADEIERLRETLVGIKDADWRKWQELASPDEFVRWAKARANHALEDVYVWQR